MTLAPEEIILSPRSAAEAVAKAQKRKKKMRLVSFCPTGGSFLAVFEESEKSHASESFSFAPVDDVTTDGFAASVTARYIASTEVVATFFINGVLWGLFRKIPFDENGKKSRDKSTQS